MLLEFYVDFLAFTLYLTFVVSAVEVAVVVHPDRKSMQFFWRELNAIMVGFTISSWLQDIIVQRAAV